MAAIGIVDRLLLVDVRFLLIPAIAGALYFRPIITRSPSDSSTASSSLRNNYGLSLRSGRGLDRVRLAQALICATLCWMAAGLVPLLLRSVTWPLVHDAPIMHYIAWRIANGAVPYRDILDMNFPGVYVIHLAVLKTFGTSDFGWRLFDFLWLVLTDCMLWKLCVPTAKKWAAIPVITYSAFHLASGAPGMGQRDFLEFAFLVGGMLPAAKALADKLEPRRLLFSGISFGCAVSIKPIAALLWLAVCALVVLRTRAEKKALGPVASLLIGGLLVPGILTAWLAVSGGLMPFLTTMSGVMPLYSRMHDRPFSVYLVEYWPVWLPCILTIPAALLKRRPDSRETLLIAGVIYGALHYVLQNKGWPYQLYPLVGFAGALLACAVKTAAETRCRSAHVAVSGLAVLFVLAIGCWKTRLQDALALTIDRCATVSSLESDLRARLGPARTFQCFDTTGGCVHALLRLKAVQSTRVLCDFLLYSYTDRPYVRQIHADLMAQLQLSKPDFVVVHRWGWPSGQYDRIAQFPELATWIAQNYRVDITRSQYTIYQRRASGHADLQAIGRYVSDTPRQTASGEATTRKSRQQSTISTNLRLSKPSP